MEYSRVIISLLFFIQDTTYRWTDNSPYVYRNWAVPGTHQWPTRRQMCATQNGFLVYLRCISLNNTGLTDLADVLRTRLQPFANNNTLLCTAMLIHDIITKWISIPCEQLIYSSLIICETNRDMLVEQLVQNKTTNNFTFYNDAYIPGKNYIYYPDYVYDIYIDDTNADLQYSPHEVYTYTDYPEYTSLKLRAVPTKHITNDGTYDTGWRSCPNTSVYLYDICVMIWEDRYNGSVTPRECYHQAFRWNNTFQQYKSQLLLYIRQWLAVDDVLYVINRVREDSTTCTTIQLVDKAHQLDTELKETGVDVPCADGTRKIYLCLSEPISRSNTDCPTGTYQCSDDTCISVEYLCDGAGDCQDNDDEEFCRPQCTDSDDNVCRHSCKLPHCVCDPLYFQCDTGGCISYHKVGTSM
jgi:hypothetical protein